ncbi:hypothetical protein [Halobacteriovorax sp. HLS]|uniref:hypothetical protein n=1 Tax=Halobacteriovorax sp. HLS TaxID=2234000 RepID=UPI0013E3FB48|nr:hypothetical protein [Halobacteriovorax sp. HLS]
MRAIIDIFLAIIFSVVVGTSGAKVISATIKKEALVKVQHGLSSLENFTKKMTTKD